MNAETALARIAQHKAEMAELRKEEQRLNATPTLDAVEAVRTAYAALMHNLQALNVPAPDTLTLSDVAFLLRSVA